MSSRITGWPADSSARSFSSTSRLRSRRDSRRRRRRADRRSNLRRAERLAFDRHDALPELAGGFGDQLLGPRAERFNGRMRDDREFVASVYRESADRGTEAHAWCGARIDGTVVGMHRAQRAIEQQGYVVARDCGGRDAHERERRIAASDVRIVFKIGGERFFLGFFIERRTGIGDRDEVSSCDGGAALFGDFFVKVRVEGVRLGRRSAFARDDEERRWNIDLTFELFDLLRAGRVEHVELRISGCSVRKYRPGCRVRASCRPYRRRRRNRTAPWSSFANDFRPATSSSMCC